MSKILLSANHIVQYFGERKILEFEKLNVYEGDHIGIVGGNGVGKNHSSEYPLWGIDPDEGSVIREVPVSYFKQFRDRANKWICKNAVNWGLRGNFLVNT